MVIKLFGDISGKHFFVMTRYEENGMNDLVLNYSNAYALSIKIESYLNFKLGIKMFS